MYGGELNLAGERVNDTGKVLNDEPVVVVEEAHKSPRDHGPCGDMAPLEPFQGDHSESAGSETEGGPFVPLEVISARWYRCVVIQHEEEVSRADSVHRGNHHIDPHVNRLKGGYAGPEVQGSVQVQEPNESDSDIETVTEAIVL